MIGCENLCGACGECEPLVSVLDDPGCLSDDVRSSLNRRHKKSANAVLDPQRLANLLARALRGRGVSFATDPDNCWIDSLHAEHGNPFDGVLIHPQALRMPQARAALSRLLALPLDCGAEKAVAALEAP